MNDVGSDSFSREFYSRQVVMRELGEAGQQKLARSRVAVVGVGGLGTVSALYLVLAGVGYVRVIDQDVVEPHNLHRQILYTSEDVYYPKVEVAAKRLEQVNPFVKVEAISENVNSNNVDRLLAGVDCVVDGLDNMLTRYVVNRACVRAGVPYVFGAAVGIEGNLSVFSTPETGCLECLMPNMLASQMQTCSSRGVLGATPGVIGSLQAMEAIKLLAGVGSTLKGKLLVCDFSDMDFTTVDISKNLCCPACCGKVSEQSKEEQLVWLCGKDMVNINPKVPLMLDIDKVYPVVSQLYKVRLKSQLALMFNYCGYEISLFNGGRMLIKGVRDEEQALSVYWEVLEKTRFV
ncbi:MAG: HesA/MoeB/ThiF family protein [Candidatus Bathyarchaeota archaeon]|nr:HesA/MoeB/ThiF family protein [Candidatus Termiticorpusculum sp.]MCL1971109.1 HesA/MoeB/ThiF family protein [Candidatus Termiticorpusculum sp.]